MYVPHNSWLNGGWHDKLPQFRPLARWMGVQSPNPSPDELQVLFKAVAPKVFADSIPQVLATTGMKEEKLRRNLREIWGRLGLGSPIPPRSLKAGRCNPSDLEGAVAFVLGGTTGWMKTRLDRTLLAHQAGAKFKRVILLGSTRKCNAPADRRTPYIYDNYAEGQEPTEIQLLRQLTDSITGIEFAEPGWPESEKPLSLEEQLRYMVDTGMYAELVGNRKVFVAVNGCNALYIPLHMRRVLGLDDIWFSQPATNAVHPVPDYWWPEDQALMTTPSGIVRLWIELKANGCIK